MIENAALITKGWSCCLLMTLQLYNWRITALICLMGSNSDFAEFVLSILDFDASITHILQFACQKRCWYQC